MYQTILSHIYITNAILDIRNLPCLLLLTFLKFLEQVGITVSIHPLWQYNSITSVYWGYRVFKELDFSIFKQV